MTSSIDIESKIGRLLARVDKPSRYMGGEFNVVRKPDGEVRVRIALAFPDIYDIGMSYHGFKILYERINAAGGLQAERVFAPWIDFEEQMRACGLPLYMLESKRALREADVVGFTLQHETNYTNVLNMLDLGGIPVEAAQRTTSDPLVIAGGHGAFNPEVLADFIDAFVIGDGEEAVFDVLGAVDRWKAAGGKDREGGREELLLALAKLPGVYVPRFYACEYGGDGTLRGIRPLRDDVPARVSKRVFDLRRDPGSVRPVVALTRIVQDRFAVEIRRGCTTGCRFCHAGMITRPVRERDPRQVVEAVLEGIRNTGHEEVSLLSLSSADHSCILEMARALRRELDPEGISLSLPSTRIDAFDVDLVREIGSVRRSGFTLAPEAGTMALRRAINKRVDEERFYEVVEKVLAAGWRTIKLYFMCGLPGETEADLDGIVEVTRRVAEMGRRRCGRNFQLNVSLSPFVPKPHTPFQWHAQPTLAELQEKYRYVESRLDRRTVSLKKHSLEETLLEGVLSRGDRRLGAVIADAWRRGARFDSWRDQLRLDAWTEAFEAAGIDPAFYSSRARSTDEVFPWDHIDAGVKKEFLLAEMKCAARGEVTPDCVDGECARCGACDFGAVRNLLSAVEDGVFTAPESTRARAAGEEVVQRLRLSFTKLGALRYVSHLDLMKVLQIVFRRCGLRLAYSGGFNPRPKMHLPPPLPLGFGSTHELLDVFLAERVAPGDVVQRLAACALEGLAWSAPQEVPVHAPAFAGRLRAADYSVTVPHSALAMPADAIAARLAAFHEAERFPVEIEGREKRIVRDLRRSVSRLVMPPDGPDAVFAMTVSLADGEYLNPVTAMELILGTTCWRDDCLALRTGFHMLQDR